MTQTLRLTEWRRSEPYRLSAELRRGLEQHFNATVASGPGLDTFVVTPGSRVGTLRLDGVDVVVVPKMPIDRVLFMVAYATDPYAWADDWGILAGAQTLVEGMARIFVQTCDRVLARGLYRSYRTVDEDVQAVRGRVRWPKQARRLAPLPIAVRRDVHDDDVLENQLVRAALARLRGQALHDRAAESGIARHWRNFCDLSSLDRPEADFQRVVWTRQNEHYRPLLTLARLIVEGSMADVDEGSLQVPGFTLFLPDVFETFVRTALRERGGLTTTQLPDDQGAHHLRLDEAGQIRLKPDLGIVVDGRWRFIGDVKYKRDADARGHQPDVYQLLAYAIAAGVPEATLIYAQGPAASPVHVIRNSGVRLNLVHLDMTREPADVLEQIGHVRLTNLPAPIR